MTGQELLTSPGKLLEAKIRNKTEFRGETTYTILPSDLREVAKFCDLAKIACRNRVTGFTSKFSFALNLFAKRFVQQSEHFLASHDNASSNLSTNSGFWFLNECSREIFSRSFIRPASKASGRGGQPEM